MLDEDFLATLLRQGEVEWFLLEALPRDEALAVADGMRLLGWFSFANQITTEVFVSDRA